MKRKGKRKKASFKRSSMGKYTGQEAKVDGQVGDEAAYRGKTQRKKENPETRTEMSMTTYATCLRANKFLVRAANCGEGIRRASRFRSVYAEGDETDGGSKERISCSATTARMRKERRTRSPSS